METQVFVGIDVSKARLDVAPRPGDESFRVANNQRGIAALVARLKKLQVGRIVLEATAVPSRRRIMLGAVASAREIAKAWR